MTQAMHRISETVERQTPEARDVAGPAVIFEESLAIPADVHSLSAFRQWAQSDRFPERGRIDYLGGDVEVHMSPEDLFTHGTVKTTIVAELHSLVTGADAGMVFVDRTRVSSPEADLSAEPDVVVVSWESLDSGRVELVPKKNKPGRFVEIQGGPDLVVEIVSDSSAGKDNKRLPRRYGAAGVRELWLVDARSELQFEIRRLEGSGYVAQPKDSAGWITSAVLERRFRLRRFRGRHGSWRYELNVR